LHKLHVGTPYPRYGSGHNGMVGECLAEAQSGGGRTHVGRRRMSAEELSDDAQCIPAKVPCIGKGGHTGVWQSGYHVASDQT
jgi:hypothetical protein